MRLMRLPQPKIRMSGQDYLRRERAAEFQSEFFDGEVYEKVDFSEPVSL